MEKRHFEFTRGDLCRRIKIEGTEDSIKPYVHELMKKISGSELVREDRGFEIGDEYHAVYFVSPEAACVRFDVDVVVRGEIYAGNPKSADDLSCRISTALEGK